MGGGWGGGLEKIENLKIPFTFMPPKKSIEDVYQKLDPRTHILVRPDTYIGSVKSATETIDIPIYNNKKDKYEMQELTINLVPGFLKIFDEILVNAIDHSVKDKTVKTISVIINPDLGYIEIENDGSGIPIEYHSEHKCWIPELIFGHLLSGSNFDDTEERIVGGRNGFGAKLTNILSTRFTLETVDTKTKKKYCQTWTNNMSEKTEPIIASTSGSGFTRIRFYPDFARFKFTKPTTTIDKDHIHLFTRRTFDASACTRKNITVKLNNIPLAFTDFQQYVNLFTDAKRVYQKETNDRGMEWEIIATPNKNPDDPFKQVSYVNGICTYKGGKHVDYITNQIVKKLTDAIKSRNKKNKDLNVRPGYIRDRLRIFIRSTIVNPAFDSQSKEYLTTNVKDFGFEFKVSDKFVTDLAKMGIEKEITEFAKFKEESQAAKSSDGRKRNKIFGIPKLDDANKAGTTQSDKCTIIFTEGDSAAAFARAGLDVIGRDYYGVFPLKGKLLNVREATRSQINNNEEISHIKQIIGLQQGKTYKSTKELRYGRVMLLVDADSDGTHIKGLLMNLFEAWWPSLFEMPGFICSLATPIVKLRKGKGASEQVKEFFTLTEYRAFMETATGKWKAKYYKGLATSNAKEAKESFQNINQKLIKYTTGDTPEEKKLSAQSIELAFKKDLADDRKEWMSKYNPDLILEQNVKTPTYTEFVNKELIHFSIYDVQRSVPSVVDGLKPSQRKILFGSFKRNLTKETIKVAQLAGYISEHCAYHHGEASLNSTITNLAYNFVGSNNINLLYPDGQFGSRNQNGKDAGSPRYIFTKLEPIATVIFNTLDTPVLKNLEEEGEVIEPEYYVPILPMVLVNGASGIGTGYSTDIPCYNPEDLIKLILELSDGNTRITEPTPWYRGFKGTVFRIDKKGSWFTRGVYNRTGPTEVEVTELPIGMSIYQFKETLNSYISETNKAKSKKEKESKTPKPELIESFEEAHKDNGNSPKFRIQFKAKKDLDDLLAEKGSEFDKTFKMVKSVGGTNMHLFDPNGIIKKYNSATDIIREFYNVRSAFYEKRYAYLKEKLEIETSRIQAKVRFIQEVISDKITVFKKSRDYIRGKLESRGYPLFPDTPESSPSYNYLTKIPLDTFTKEVIAELEKKKEDTERELAELIGKTPIKLWKEDLVEFYEKYESFEDQYNSNS